MGRPTDNRVDLSDASVVDRLSIPDGKDMQRYWDSRQDHLALDLRLSSTSKTPSKYWRWVRNDGKGSKQFTRTLGEYVATHANKSKEVKLFQTKAPSTKQRTYKEAAGQAALNDHLVDIKKYDDFNNAKAASKLNIRRVFNEFMAEKDHAEKTKYNYNLWFKKIEAEFGKYELSEIKRIDIVKWHSSFKLTTPVEGNRSLKLLKTLLNWAISPCEYIEKSPANKIDMHDEEERGITLDRDKFAAFWKACLVEDNGDLWRVMLLCGQRLDEVSSMRWDQLDLEAEYPIWGPYKSKTSKKTYAALSTPCVAILQNRKQRAKIKSPFVFPREDNPDDYIPLKHDEWERITKAIGQPNLTRHDLRRTFSTLMPKLGIQPYIIKRAMNHLPSDTDERYGMQMPFSDVWQAVEQTSDWIMELAGANYQALAKSK